MTSLALYAKALGGDAVGRSRVICPSPGHSAKDRSLSVTFGSAGFLVHSFAGDDWQTCRDYVRDLLGMGDGRFARPSAEELEKVRQEDEQQAIRQEKRARECWNASLPISGTVAESYLRGRGITCSLPSSLRFNPDCYHPSTKRLPALVAAVEALSASRCIGLIFGLMAAARLLSSLPRPCLERLLVVPSG